MTDLPPEDRAPPAADGLADLVLDLGEPQFPERCFAALHRWLGIEQLVIFRRDAAGTLSSPLALHARQATAAQALARLYLHHYHRRDPHRDWLLPTAGERSLLLRTSAARDLPDSEYRARLFDEPALGTKLAIISRAAQGSLYINLYRGDATGAFGEQEQARLGLLAHLVEKHLALTAAPATLTLDELRRRVAAVARALGAPLSARELETCARIACGHTARAIAADLGVGYDTVVTFRKRAFLKLGIASHTGLLPLLLRHGG